MSVTWITHGKKVLDIEIQALTALRDRLGKDFSDAVELVAACPGRLVLTGIGKSGLIGRKIAATLSSTGTPSFFLHPVESLHGDLGSLRDDDIVLAISYSGKTVELLNLMPAIKRLGLKVIAMTSDASSPLAGLADLFLDIGVEREACSLNVVPTSSTTVTLALGDALAMCLMEHKSFTSKDFYRYHPGGTLGKRLALHVGELMHKDGLPCVDERLPLREALRVLDAKRFGVVFVVDEGKKLLGIVTDGDVRRMLCRGGMDQDVAVSEVMGREPVWARADTDAAKILDVMEGKGITVVPVVDEGMKVEGIVHMHDVLGRGDLRFS